MDCCEVQNLLSEYYDDELPGVSRSAVAKHLDECSACAQELAGFEKLSGMAHELEVPETPATIWSQIEQQLDADSVTVPAAHHERKFPMLPGLAVAAVILIAAGIAIYWTAMRDDGRIGPNEMAENFGHYLERFERDPNEARSFLVAKYQGRTADIEEAARQLGYRPVVSTGMPDNFSLGDVYVMDMPCCKCVHCTCQRDDGKVLAIFEHDEKDPDWFGDRTVTTARCGGKECRVVQVDDRLAVSWKEGNRHITVVGVSGLEEIDEIVEWFHQADEAEPG